MAAEGHPERVKRATTSPPDAIGKAIPYGIYDLGANAGWVSVGTDHDTSAFAAATLRRWWRADGSARYPEARRLLICADSGGSNAARARAWKVELARLAVETGLEITCCHYPPGTSKWNKCVWPGGRPGVMKCGRGGPPGAVAVSTVER